MPYGHGTIDASIASAASKSTIITIQGWGGIALEMPSFGTLLATSTCNVYVEVSQTSTTGNFRRLKAMGVYSAASGIEDWEIPSTTGDWITECKPAAGFNYLRVHLSTAATDAISCTVHVYKPL